MTALSLTVVGATEAVPARERRDRDLPVELDCHQCANCLRTGIAIILSFQVVALSELPRLATTDQMGEIVLEYSRPGGELRSIRS
jgi:hypothetical protein